MRLNVRIGLLLAGAHDDPFDTANVVAFTGTAADRAFETSGKAIGDIELAWRYQLNEGGIDKPCYIAGMRFKSRTGRAPFQVVTDCQARDTPDVTLMVRLPFNL